LFPKCRQSYLSRNSTVNRVAGLRKKCDVCGAWNRDEANYCLRCGQSFFIRTAPAQSSAPEVQMGFSPSWFGRLALGCLFHPGIRCQFICTVCGVPLCSACMRLYLLQPYCPVCFAHNSVVRQRGIPIALPWLQLSQQMYYGRLVR
jgi:hypothetical protein